MSVNTLRAVAWGMIKCPKTICYTNEDATERNRIMDECIDGAVELGWCLRYAYTEYAWEVWRPNNTYVYGTFEDMCRYIVEKDTLEGNDGAEGCGPAQHSLSDSMGDA
jgi:hypothetical protein